MSGRNPFLVERQQGLGTTNFAEMSALAARTGAINLGQGFPDTDGPSEVAEAAIDAIRAGHNQYPPGIGIAELREAIAEHQKRFWGLTVDRDSEVLVTAGATEAITAAVLSLCEPGEEILTFEPTYDSYRAAAAMAGAAVRAVRLEAPDYHFDVGALRDAVTAMRSRSTHTRAMASSSATSNTLPVGLCGELTSTSLVRGVTASRSAPTSKW